MRHERFMEIARLIAAQSHCMPQHGALIVRGNRIINAPTNIARTHPVFLKAHHPYIKTIHAEMKVLLNTDCHGATLYSARNIRGLFGKSKPCKTCAALIIAAEIKTLVYWEDGIMIEKL